MARKSKSGKRFKCGKLKRSVRPVTFDRGTERAQARAERYGANGADAIGRAYARGLLGEGQDAKDMLDTARAIFRAYWSSYAIGAVKCPLADRTGASVVDDEERERRQEAWLASMLRRAESRGPAARALFDQLCIDLNADEGPPFLDRVLDRTAGEGDWRRLTTALHVLATCADVAPPVWKMREAA